jgi:hypothetical protein
MLSLQPGYHLLRTPGGMRLLLGNEMSDNLNLNRCRPAMPKRRERQIFKA